ncbi:MAG: hypothetical protein P8Z42_05365 [Anaerolineales bacterium]
MSEMADFRQIQRRVFQLVSFEDGLWDLLLGLIFLALAVYPVTRELLGPEWNIVLFVALLLLLSVGQLLVRRRVSGPRIGVAVPRRTPKMWLLLVITFVMVVITIGLVVLTLLAPEPELAANAAAQASSGRGYLVELVVVLVMGLLFSAMGYLFGVTRMYFYGWMIGLANLASVYMEHNAGWTFQIPLAVAAGIILLIGLVLLVRFLRTYPLPAEGD